MAVDLKKTEKKFDELIATETPESAKKWLETKRKKKRSKKKEVFQKVVYLKKSHS